MKVWSRLPITERDLASDLSIDPGSVSKWINFKRVIPNDKLTLIALKYESLLEDGSVAVLQKKAIELRKALKNANQDLKSLTIDLRGTDPTDAHWLRIDGEAETVDYQLGEPADDHYGRLKYWGFHGGRNWSQLVASDYERRAQPQVVADLSAELIEEIFREVKTFVSMGPGDGKQDSLLMAYLGRLGIRPEDYIPVDICAFLLGRSMRELRNAGFRVPFGMLCDFEESMPRMFDRLKHVSNSPRLFSILGNTLGNLDGHQTTFIDQLSDNLNSEDAVLFHVSIYDPVTYQLQSDPYYNKELSNQFVRFLAYAVGRKRRIETEEAVRRFSELVTTELESSSCCVPDALAIIFKDKDFAHPVLSIWRFRLDSFEEWLIKKGFTVVSKSLMGEGGLGHGVLLLKRN
ncbi:MAG: L-histidine N(alpha)-methyltransferase [Fimbriimonadaceae bacterium]|nr:L-histidine N(alpha)-methyltransferase [Fimbriimonadaceae bacterium]